MLLSSTGSYNHIPRGLKLEADTQGIITAAGKDAELPPGWDQYLPPPPTEVSPTDRSRLAALFAWSGVVDGALLCVAHVRRYFME
jgi:hypothetical protein